MRRTTPWLPLLTLGLLATTASLGRAEIVLNFDDLTPPILFLAEYQSQGFTLDTVEPGFGFRSFGPADLGFYTGQTALALGTSGTSARLARDDGALFALLGIDLSKWFAFDPNATVHFIGTRADGSTVETEFTTSTAVGVIALQSFEFPTSFWSIKEVRWAQNFPFHQFDNIRLDQAAVPEPATWSLMVLGATCAVVVGRARRRS